MDAFRRYRTFSLALVCALVTGLCAPLLMHVCTAQARQAAGAMDCCPKAAHPPAHEDAPSNADSDADPCCLRALLQPADMPAVAPELHRADHVASSGARLSPTPRPTDTPAPAFDDTGPPPRSDHRSRLSVWLI